jgi:hypothetical protein
MLSAVEEKQGWEKTLTQLKKSAWKSMHSYTHGGMQLISRRFKDAYVEHNVDEEEIIGILQLVNLIAFLSLNEAKFLIFQKFIAIFLFNYYYFYEI